MEEMVLKLLLITWAGLFLILIACILTGIMLAARFLVDRQDRQGQGVDLECQRVMQEYLASGKQGKAIRYDARTDRWSLVPFGNEEGNDDEEDPTHTKA